jgi:hypothetical protein
VQDASPAEIEPLERWASDPLSFVLECFPWGQGELVAAAGPRQWQRETLSVIGARVRAGAAVDEAIQIATASGHGIGKSALVAMVILWAICTRIDTRGVVTANTEKQLTTKTWPELAKWHRLCLLRESFTFTATALYSADPAHEKTWRIDAIPWSLTNTEAFAGLHNKGRRILVVFDEASAIPDQIWEVTEGALTDSDTEILWLAFGNPTRNTGRFRECFGRLRHRWIGRQIDSREVDGTNLGQLQKWVDDYGEDSDFVRVRVRGVFPRAGVSQFIPSDLVEAAQKRKLDFKDAGAPFVLGVDLARFGDDESVIRGRQGRDGRVIKPIKWRGMDTVFSAGKVAETIQKYNPDAVFIDGGGVGGGVIDILKSQGFRVIEVNFGATARAEKKFRNKSAEMWSDARDWLGTGSIDDDPKLRDDLCGREYGYDKDGRIELEKKDDMKKRGLASPDDADAFVLTFAQPVQRKDLPTSRAFARPRVAQGMDYNVLG